MKILIIDTAEPADALFNQPLFDFVSNAVDCDVVNYTAIPPRQTVQMLYGAIIISGVPLHYPFESVESRLPYFRWLRRTQLPILGICLGHQLIAKLFNAQIVHDLEAENGLLDTYAQQSDPIFSTIEPVFESFMMHRASTTVPKQFRALAYSDRCANIIMKHKRKPIYGFQAHPELSPSGVTLLRNFVSLAEARNAASTIKQTMKPASPSMPLTAETT